MVHNLNKADKSTHQGNRFLAKKQRTFGVFLGFYPKWIFFPENPSLSVYLSLSHPNFMRNLKKKPVSPFGENIFSN